MSLSLDGKMEAYIRNYNLFVKDRASGQEKQLTTDGVKELRLCYRQCGLEAQRSAILVWSPDSKKIASFQQDERNVSDVYLVPVTVGAPKLQQWKSALPGDANIAMIERVIIDVDSAKVTRLQMPADRIDRQFAMTFRVMGLGRRVLVSMTQSLSLLYQARGTTKKQTFALPMPRPELCVMFMKRVPRRSMNRARLEAEARTGATCPLRMNSFGTRNAPIGRI
jgi:hypothetical protein